jgi:hypothetical protein
MSGAWGLLPCCYALNACLGGILEFASATDNEKIAAASMDAPSHIHKSAKVLHRQ